MHVFSHSFYKLYNLYKFYINFFAFNGIYGTFWAPLNIKITVIDAKFLSLILKCQIFDIF
jgi:hypothetical protein